MLSLNSLIEEVSLLSHTKFNKNQLAKKMGKSRQWINTILNRGEDQSPVNQVKMLIAMQDFLLDDAVNAEITIRRQQHQVQELWDLIEVIKQHINDVAMDVSEVEK